MCYLVVERNVKGLLPGEARIRTAGRCEWKRATKILEDVGCPFCRQSKEYEAALVAERVGPIRRNRGILERFLTV